MGERVRSIAVRAAYSHRYRHTSCPKNPGNRLETVRYQWKSTWTRPTRLHGEWRFPCRQILSPAVVLVHGLVAGCRVGGVGNPASPE